MRSRTVLFAPEAREDVLQLYNQIARRAGSTVVLNYIERLETFCMNLEWASERGQRRDDIRVGLRIVGFERRVTIAFTVEPATVTILRLLYGGRDWEDLLG